MVSVARRSLVPWLAGEPEARTEAARSGSGVPLTQKIERQLQEVGDRRAVAFPAVSLQPLDQGG
jgi:hypothetical protein